MDANKRGIMLVKRDRIMERIHDIKPIYERETKQKIDSFVQTIEAIITNELTDKGVERVWKD